MKVTRRDVLKGAAALAGGASSGVLSPSLLRALSAAPVAGKLTDIDHVVIMIQENRSFDHYFGRYKGVRGFEDKSPGAAAIFQQAFKQSDAAGWPDPLRPFHLPTNPPAVVPRQGECSNDIDHQWYTQHYAWNGGALNRWVEARVDPAIVPSGYSAADGPLTMAYFDRSDLAFYYALADNFTICDRYHCSAIGGTDINRIFSMSGTMDPDGWDVDAKKRFLDTNISGRNGLFGVKNGRWRSYPEVLEQAGVSWKVYQADASTATFNNVLTYWKSYGYPSAPGSDLYKRAFTPTFPADFLADCMAGTLPRVSWILAQFALDAEHPPAPIEWGQDAVRNAVTALSLNPATWNSSALFVTYDENGGFFDHVPPPMPPPHTEGEFLANLDPASPAYAQARAPHGGVHPVYVDPIGLGYRVPMIVVSPFSRNPHSNPTDAPLVCSDVFDHTSLLRFVETWLGAKGVAGVGVPDRDPASRTPGLSEWRRDVVGDLTSAFNFAAGGQSFAATSLPLTNRADPRVLTECILTGTAPHFVNAQAPSAPVAPPPAPQPQPGQEDFTGDVQHPSGPPVATGPSPSPTGSSPGSAGSPGPGPSGPPLAGQANTAAGPPWPDALELALIGAGAAAAWWAVRKGRLTSPDGGVAGPDAGA